ncbi:hypothetical protein BESB_045630 [Besnoitia besnoiti]|uniref:ADP-ribosylation factor n=1 Tax=Besnoitia besnoiti TaxID=94643 RepID=A0A2A9MJE6_BESBE|nr:hypothetical protein BESB_045630 [Besnoitia besnoiti]PFH36371.1 hypothetical protein BESB_045630 [Besnoitia besnoiti]
MFSLVSGLYRWMFSYDELRLLLLGVDGSGKTTFQEQLKTLYAKPKASLARSATSSPTHIGSSPPAGALSASPTTCASPCRNDVRLSGEALSPSSQASSVAGSPPCAAAASSSLLAAAASSLDAPLPRVHATIGFSPLNFVFESFRVTVWDVGGQESLRAIWPNYYADCHCVVFFVDAADAERRAEALDAFQCMRRELADAWAASRVSRESEARSCGREAEDEEEELAGRLDPVDLRGDAAAGDGRACAPVPRDLEALGVPPVLLVANKQDLPHAISAEALRSLFLGATTQPRAARGAREPARPGCRDEAVVVVEHTARDVDRVKALLSTAARLGAAAKAVLDEASEAGGNAERRGRALRGKGAESAAKSGARRWSDDPHAGSFPQGHAEKERVDAQRMYRLSPDAGLPPEAGLSPALSVPPTALPPVSPSCEVPAAFARRLSAEEGRYDCHEGALQGRGAGVLRLGVAAGAPSGDSGRENGDAWRQAAQIKEASPRRPLSRDSHRARERVSAGEAQQLPAGRETQLACCEGEGEGEASGAQECGEESSLDGPGLYDIEAAKASFDLFLCSRLGPQSLTCPLAAQSGKAPAAGRHGSR